MTNTQRRNWWEKAKVKKRRTVWVEAAAGATGAAAGAGAGARAGAGAGAAGRVVSPASTCAGTSWQRRAAASLTDCRYLLAEKGGISAQKAPYPCWRNAAACDFTTRYFSGFLPVDPSSVVGTVASLALSTGSS